MANELSIIVRVKNLVGQGLGAAGNAIKNFGSSAMGGIKSALGSMGGMIAGFAGISAAAMAFKKGITEAFNIEKVTAQFSIFMGSSEKATKHIDDLRASLGDTLFGFDAMASASKTMMQMTGGILGGVDSLKQIGDIAASTGKPIEEVGSSMAKAYAMMGEGESFSRAGMNLLNMGVISGETMVKLNKMEEAGASNIEIWDALQKSLEVYNGGMETMQQTGDGLMKTLSDSWDDTLTQFGQTFMDVAKDGIKTLIDWLGKLQEDGTLDRWAANAKDALEGLVTVISTVAKGIGWLVDKMKYVSGVAGAMSTGLIPEAMPQVDKSDAQEAADIERKAQERAAKKQKAKEEAEAKAAAASSPGAKTELRKNIEDDFQKKRIEQAAEIEKALADAKKDIDKLNREAEGLQMKPFEFKLATAGTESANAGKKRLKDELDIFKEELELRKQHKQLTEQVRDAEVTAREKDWSKQVELADKKIETHGAALTRAQTDRRATVRERRATEREQAKKAWDRGFSEEELADFKKRAENEEVNDLTKQEKMALKEDAKFQDKAQKLKERAKQGQRLSQDEKRLLREAEQQGKVREAQTDKDVAKKNLEELQKDRDKWAQESAADLKVIKEKIEKTLTLKDGG